MTVRFIFAWYDLWVGAFWDQKGRRLYLLPFPCCGIVIQFTPLWVKEIHRMKQRRRSAWDPIGDD